MLFLRYGFPSMMKAGPVGCRGLRTCGATALAQRNSQAEGRRARRAGMRAHHSYVIMSWLRHTSSYVVTRSSVKLSQVVSRCQKLS